MIRAKAGRCGRPRRCLDAPERCLRTTRLAAQGNDVRTRAAHLSPALTVHPATARGNNFAAHGLTIMRRFFVVLLSFAFAVVSARAVSSPLRAATPEEVALLKDAMKSSSQDTEHWAYTETTSMRDKKGKKFEESVIRFDPSKPYAEQYTPLSIDGKPPTEKHLKKYRKEGEKRGKQLRKAAESQKKKNPDDPPKLSINDDKAVLDLDHSLVVREEAGRITMEIPLRVEKGSDIPVEKFEILVQIGKSSRQ